MALAEQLARPTVAVAEAERGESAKANSKSTHHLTLIVENMNCGACMNRIERALGAASGVVAKFFPPRHHL